MTTEVTQDWTKVDWRIWNFLTERQQITSLQDKHGYVTTPSSLLKRVGNGSYKPSIAKLKELGIIDTYRTDTCTVRDSYSDWKHVSIKYRTKDLDVKMPFSDRIKRRKDQAWWRKTVNMLKYMGVPTEQIRIFRDKFANRVYHNVTQCYKFILEDFIDELCQIDMKCCQPTLLYYLLKEKGIIDEHYNEIFEEGKDFYNVLMNKFKLESREEAKKLFMNWAFGGPHFKHSEEITTYFRRVNDFMKCIKKDGLNNFARLLTSKEVKLFIRGILSNIPLTHCLTIHDSIIIHRKEKDIALKWLRDHYPGFQFVLK